MSDPLIARFADACGATAPLHLRVDLVGGNVLAEGSVGQPFTLVGRDDACDVTLSDPDINPRHVWLQVLAGRVYALDLGSRTGVVWPNGARGSGWLDPGTSAKIGPFSLRLSAPVTDRPGTFPLDYNPLAADPNARGRGLATLEFRNGKRARDRWAVNRVVTLVGRSPECKIHLTADDIALYHCGLVSTPTGLWVVDLSGRGVVVNGERMRVAPLPHGAELWVGRFLIGCQSQTPPTSGGPHAGHNGTPGGPRTANAPQPDHGAANAPSSGRTPRVPALVGATGRAAGSEDEVELGAAPDPTADLPASHIMADAFRGPSLNGPASNPILVSGAGVAADGPVAGLLDSFGLDHARETGLAPLLRQMADLHDRTAHEFTRWLSLLPRLFSYVQREHLAVVLHELTRIETLTAEIAKLQGEVSRRALEQAAADRGQHTAPEPTGRAPNPDTPLPVSASDTVTPPPIQTADRLSVLQQERADRWAAVITLFAGR